MHFFSPMVQNPSKVSVKDRLGFSSKPAASVEKVSVHFLLEFLSFYFKLCKCYMLSRLTPFQVFSTSMGLTKTVYNPAALKAAQKTSEEALKKKQVRGEMEGVVGKREGRDSEVRPQ